MRPLVLAAAAVVGLVLGCALADRALAHDGFHSNICENCSHVRSSNGSTSFSDDDDLIEMTGSGSVMLPDCTGARVNHTKTVARRGAIIVVSVGVLDSGDRLGGTLNGTLSLVVDLGGRNFTCDGAGNWIAH